MANPCIKCGIDLPASAGGCIYCGTPQTMAPQQNPSAPHAYPAPKAAPYNSGQFAPPTPGTMPPHVFQQPSRPAAAPYGNVNQGTQNTNFGQPPGTYTRGHLQVQHTQQVKPLPAPNAKQDILNWDYSLTTLMLVFGVLLVACFVAPWSILESNTIFSFTVLSSPDATSSAKLLPLLLMATGIAAVTAGTVKLRPLVRSIIAAFIGTTPILFGAMSQAAFQWQWLLAATAIVILITGLILRSRFQDEILGRILATIGAVLLLLLLLIPDNGVMPIKSIFQQLSQIPGKGKLVPILGFQFGSATLGIIPMLFCLLAGSVWLPANRSTKALELSWLLIFWGCIAALASWIAAENMLTHLKENLSLILYLPFSTSAWLALASFGFAGVLGNSYTNTNHA